MHNFLLSILLCFFISGCTPPLPLIDLQHGDRIGLFVEATNELSHKHIGATVFSNFFKKYNYNWNLRTAVSDTVKKTFREANFSVVDLNAEGVSYADLNGLIVPDIETWKVAAGKEAIFHKLYEQLKLKAVVVIKESEVNIDILCAGGPCSERVANLSGLYTHPDYGKGRYTAVAAFKWNVFVLAPPADTARADPLRSILNIPTAKISGYADPVNLENITEAEFAPIHEAIIRIVENTAKLATKTLQKKK